jgi:hypothetical protein
MMKMQKTKLKNEIILRLKRLKKLQTKNYYFYFSLFSLLIISSCKKDNEENIIYGNLYLSSFYVEKKCLSDESLFELEIDKESKSLFFFKIRSDEVYEAKFRFTKHNDSLKIYNSTLNGLDGNYLIDIDTLLSSVQRCDVSITLNSKSVYIKGYKSKIKKIM